MLPDVARCRAKTIQNLIQGFGAMIEKNEELAKVNQRLKAAKTKVAIEQRCNRLNLIATLPPKPGSGKTKPSRQRISLGVYANTAGFKIAEIEAKKLGVQLAERAFAWQPLAENTSVEKEMINLKKKEEIKVMTEKNEQLAKVNQRLKAAKTKVTIEQRCERLNLIATLPPKPGSGKNKPYRQRIALGVYANPVGFKVAETEAKKLGIKLAEKTFAWPPLAENMTVEKAIAKFEKQYFTKRERNDKSETTYDTSYHYYFSKLDLSENISESLLLNCIHATKPNTRSRVLCCYAMKNLGAIADINIDITLLKGSYSPKEVNPRNLPSDSEIQKFVELIDDPAWRWVYGMMATFGLRNHEVFFIDHETLINQGICYVLEGKTTSGKVWPLYPEWLDFFSLQNIQVPVFERKTNQHREYGAAVSNKFKTMKIPFTPYALRHSWARRAIEMGLDSRLAAKQMRHSHSVHVQVYNAWLDDSIHQNAFNLILSNPNRPKPPSLDI
jgi:integrase